MRMQELISKKKHGNALSQDEINFIVNGYTKGIIPDYQMSAFLMAVYFQGMTREETADFTLAMVNSGEQINLSHIPGTKVDKHSTGGVGDKLSLVIIPLCACMEIPVIKMSGRGLGHTGGTIDKLESIEGFRTELSEAEFTHNANQYKMAIVGQSPHLTPADKKIYALRDATSTVDSLPLIASSIMSKKIASGADCIVLDVKVGSGAFMKTIKEAKDLAQIMVELGNSLGRKTVAIITDMNQPLGREIGNANEVREAISILKGEGEKDETEVALTIAAYMGVLGGAAVSFEQAYGGLKEFIKTGAAFEKFRQLIEIQGGNVDLIDNPEKLPTASHNIQVISEYQGYVVEINAEQIGICAMLLGAGRRNKGDGIDYSAGVTMVKKLGDKVNVGDTLCVLHTNLSSWNKVVQLVQNAFTFGYVKPEPISLIHYVIKGQNATI